MDKLEHINQPVGVVEFDSEEDLPLCWQYHEAIEFIGRRWMGSILFVLMQGPGRYNELLAAIPGISDRLLTQRLRELQEQGLVVRRVVASSPVKVEYELTEAGRDLHEVVRSVLQWGQKWLQSTTRGEA
ncbi:MAG: helix-turn-helix domain-containing protein [Anaerolineaceae bacterium]|nr:helix-turn-helix domain-containing protein [Anaerolineaceae bacterium]